MLGRPPQRWSPAGPPNAYKTYSVQAPRSTHFRVAGCAEVDCQWWREGWMVPVPRDQRADAEARLKAAGYRWTEVVDDGTTVRFVIPPGQPCFQADGHRVRLEREARYVVRGGDFRGNPSGEVRVHQRPEDFVEDWAAHQDKLRKHLAGGN